MTSRIKVIGPKQGTAGATAELGEVDDTGLEYDEAGRDGGTAIFAGQGWRQLIALLGNGYMVTGFHLIVDGTMLVECRIVATSATAEIHYLRQQPWNAA